MLNGGHDPREPLRRYLQDTHPNVKVPDNCGHEELLRIIDRAEGRPSPAEARALDHSKQQQQAHKRDTDSSAAWWKALDARVAETLEQHSKVMLEAIAQHVGEKDALLINDYRAKIAALESKLAALEAKTSVDARFSELERHLAARQLALNDAKYGSELSQRELQARIDGMRRQLDEVKNVADLDRCFRELTERVGELEKINSLDARFTKLAHEVKNGCELAPSELPARIDGLERQLDDLKRVPGQPGPQGPSGPPGKLLGVKEYLVGRVHYEADIVVHAGALWQASSDTVHAPPHSNWICIARGGRDGCDGRSPNVCGAYDAREKYERLDIVAFDGATFIARRDNPGICPGDGWQLLSGQGRPGRRGETGERGVRGDKGERGEPGATVVSWQIDPERYRISPLMSDGKVGPMLELRALFEQYHAEASQ